LSNISSDYKGEWIQIKLPSSIPINKFLLSSIPTQSPTNFILIGSNDETNWKEIKSYSNISWKDLVQVFDTNNTVPYIYYRLIMNKINSSLQSLVITEFSLYQIINQSSTTSSVFKSSNNLLQMSSVNMSGLTNPLDVNVSYNYQWSETVGDDVSNLVVVNNKFPCRADHPQYYTPTTGYTDLNNKDKCFLYDGSSATGTLRYLIKNYGDRQPVWKTKVGDNTDLENTSVFDYFQGGFVCKAKLPDGSYKIGNAPSLSRKDDRCYTDIKDSNNNPVIFTEFDVLSKDLN
jgi:hypothetical protein